MYRSAAMRFKGLMLDGIPRDANGGGGGGNGDVTPVDLKKLAEELKSTAAGVKASNEEVKKIVEQAVKDVKSAGDMATETKAKFDEVLTKHNGMSTQLMALEQKFVAVERGGGGGGGVERKSLGDIFVDSKEFKDGNWTSSKKGHVSVKISRKDITSATSTQGSNTSVGTSLVPADMQPGIVAPPERTLTIRDLIAPGRTASNSIEYAQETGFTNNADMVSEGTTKPKSDITFELRTAPVRTLAHIFKASRQILDDAPALRSYIDARARYGLRYAEELELLAGDGTGQHLRGLITEATAYSPSFSAPIPVQQIDKIRLAMLQVMLAEFPSTGIVLNPIDWAYIQLLKDSMGRYLIGDPQGVDTPRLWNLPVVETQAMAVDKFLVGNFRIAAQIFDRLDLEILLSTENVDDFEKNMVTIRAEERLALAVYRPEAFVYGDFGRVT